MEANFHAYEEGAIDSCAALANLGAKGEAVDAILMSSIAISLKRIADALEGRNVHALDTLMESAGQAFALGMRGR